jgi:hypothetical protein
VHQIILVGVNSQALRWTSHQGMDCPPTRFTLGRYGVMLFVARRGLHLTKGNILPFQTNSVFQN